MDEKYFLRVETGLLFICHLVKIEENCSFPSSFVLPSFSECLPHSFLE